jgi:hypothetical protein
MKESSLPTPSPIKLAEEILDRFDQSKTFLALPPPNFFLEKKNASYAQYFSR